MCARRVGADKAESGIGFMDRYGEAGRGPALRKYADTDAAHGDLGSPHALPRSSRGRSDDLPPLPCHSGHRKSPALSTLSSQ